MEGSISDHSPAIIMVGKIQSLSKFSIFGLIMRDLWIGGWRISVVGTCMFQLYTKIKSVKKVLKEVNKEEFDSLQLTVIQDQVRLEQLKRM